MLRFCWPVACLAFPSPCSNIPYFFSQRYRLAAAVLARLAVRLRLPLSCLAAAPCPSPALLRPFVPGSRFRESLLGRSERRCSFVTLLPRPLPTLGSPGQRKSHPSASHQQLGLQKVWAEGTVPPPNRIKKEKDASLSRGVVHRTAAGLSISPASSCLRLGKRRSLPRGRSSRQGGQGAVQLAAPRSRPRLRRRAR